MNPLSGKVALVTGASAPRGIGRAIAMKLAEQGAAVVLTDIRGKLSIDGIVRDTRELLNKTVSEIELKGGQASALSVDVTQQKDIGYCIDKTREAYGGIDVLVNNAGSLAGSDYFLETTAEQWQTSFQVNLLGPMMFSQAVIPEMREKGGGSIVNIGSTGSLGAEPGFGAYTTMKHGLIGLTKTIAAEFGKDGIRCNAVCPGFIMTDMHAAANERLADQNNVSVADMMKQRYQHVALRKAGEPDDVAEAVSYLVGSQGAYVTGIVLPVAGGVPFGI